MKLKRNQVHGRDIRPGDQIAFNNFWAEVRENSPMGQGSGTDAKHQLTLAHAGGQSTFTTEVLSGAVYRIRGRNRIKPTEVSPRYDELSKEFKGMGLEGFCGPLAYAVLTGCTAAEAIKAVPAYRSGSGTSVAGLLESLKAFGFTVVPVPFTYFTDRYSTSWKFKSVTSHHPKRWAADWPHGRFLFFPASHFFTVVDGVTHCWASNKALRCKNAYALLLPGETIPGHHRVPIHLCD